MVNRYLIYVSETNGVNVFPLYPNQSGVSAYAEALERNGENQYNTTAYYIEIRRNAIAHFEKVVLDN